MSEHVESGIEYEFVCSGLCVDGRNTVGRIEVQYRDFPGLTIGTALFFANALLTAFHAANFSNIAIHIPADLPMEAQKGYLTFIPGTGSRVCVFFEIRTKLSPKKARGLLERAGFTYIE